MISTAKRRESRPGRGKANSIGGRWGLLRVGARGRHQRQSTSLVLAAWLALSSAVCVKPMFAAPRPARPDRLPVAEALKARLNLRAENERPIRLVNEVFLPGGSLEVNSGRLRAAGADPGRIHAIVRLSAPPGQSRVQQLESEGVRILGYLPDDAFFASIPNTVATVRLRVAGVAWLGAVYPEDKLPDRIRSSGIGTWAMRPDGTADLCVKYFADASPGRVVEEVRACDATVLGSDSLRHELTVNLPAGNVGRLASCESVRWIEEVPPPPVLFNDGARANAQADAVQLSPYDLSGTNVAVGVWDGGAVDASHGDLLGRVVGAEQNLGVDLHSTHVAGTLAGSGALSGGQGGAERQWRGMATGATIVSYEFNNPILEHESAINAHGVVLSQNSWGFLMSELIGTCNIVGHYSHLAPDYDRIITGLYGRPISVVFAAGNVRNDLTTNSCNAGPYQTIGPPSTAKNVITVGAINSDDNTMTIFSGWGPVSDGRLKPELVAPGDEVAGDGGITSIQPGNSYAVLRGTSMAAPVVSGAIALLVEDYRGHYSGQDPWPSTARALLVHTAADLDDDTSGFNTGPDYASGYGRVQIQAAVDQLRSQGFLVGQTGHGETRSYSLSVPEGTTAVKVTLVWDDPAALENAGVTLVNDLDLVVIDPNGNRHFPWTLDPANPSSPAVQTREDHLNVIEQVLIDSDVQPGTWMVNVVGYNVPAGSPQKFTLVFSPSTIPAPPLLIIDAAMFSDNSGEAANRDGFIDPGETIQANVILRSVDGPAATNVSATILADTPGITLVTAEAGYPDLPTGSVATNLTVYSFRVDKTVPCGSTLTFTHVTSANGFLFTNRFDTVIGHITITNLATNTFDSVEVPKTIPDAGSTVSTNDIPIRGRILDLEVSARIDHTWYGDINLRLEHPDGSSIQLVAASGNSGENFGAGACGSNEVRTVFDDEASAAFSDALAPFAGSFQPDEPLAGFDGMPLQGPWRLRVTDVVTEDTGTLLCWGVTVAYEQAGYVCNLFNRSPVVSAQEVAVVYGAPTTITLIGTDADGDPITFHTNRLPSNGVLSAFDASSGTVTYTPAPGYVGSDSFEFEVTDGYTNSSVATVNITVLPPMADLVLALSAAPDPVVLDGRVTYSLAVTNSGPNEASGVAITNALAAGMSHVSSVTSQGSVTNEGGLVRFDLGELGVGSNAVMTVVVTAEQLGMLTNMAVVTANEVDVNPANNRAEAVSRVKLAVDVAVDLRASPDPVLMGQELAYEVGVTNRGPNGTTAVVVMDTLPAEVSLVNLETSQGISTNDNGTVRFELGELGVGSNAVMRVVVRPTATGMVTNAVRVSVHEIDVNSMNNEAEAVVRIEPAADLAVSQAAEPPVGLVGQELRLTMSVTNFGPSTATDVVLTNQLPAGVELISVETSQGVSSNDNSAIHFELGELRAGSNAVARVVVRPTEAGTLTNAVGVSGVETDVQGGNNTSELVVLVEPAADLAVSQAVDREAALVGQEVRFTIAVTNLGPSAATGVAVTNHLPRGVTLITVETSQGASTNANGVVRFELGELGAGSNALMVVVISANELGTLTNAAAAGASQADVNGSNNLVLAVSRIKVDADLAVSLAAEPDPVLVGGELRFELVVTNLGPNAADTVRVEDRLPEGVTLISLETTQGTVTNVGGVVVGDLGEMTNGASAAVRVVVRPTITGTLTNTAFVSADVIDLVSTNNVATSMVVVEPAADLVLSGAVFPDPVLVGGPVTNGWVVENRGPNGASGVVVSGTWTNGLIVESVSASQGQCTNLYGVVTCDLGDLANGINASITVVARAEALGQVTNTMAVSAAEADPVPANNTASVVSRVKWDVDVGLELALGPVPVLAGERLLYLLSVTNCGPNVASGVRLEDRLPEGVEVVTVDATQGSVLNTAGTVVGEFGELSVGGSATLTIVVRPGVTGLLTNVATVTVEEIDVDPTNNTVVAVVEVQSAVDVELVQAVEAVTGLVGQPLSFVGGVTNHGPSEASRVRVRSPLPEGASLLSAQASQGSCTNAEGTVICDLGGLSRGGSATLRITVRPERVGELTNSVSVTAAETDVDAANNRAVTVVSVNPAADLAVLAGVSAEPVLVGSELNYELVVTNRGPSSASGVRLEDTLPAGVTLISVAASQGSMTNTNGTVICELGELTNGASATVTVVVSAGHAGSLTNEARVEGLEADPEPGDNAVSVLSRVKVEADLAMRLVAEPDPVLVGGELSYELVVTNFGPNTAREVRVEERLPEGVILISLETTQGMVTNVSGVLFGELGEMTNGAVASVRVVVRPTITGPLTNTVSVSADVIDPNPDDNRSTAVVSAHPLADLVIIQEAFPDPVLVDNDLRYTVTVLNQSDYAVPAVSLLDTLPLNVNLLFVTLSQGFYTNQPGAVVCDLGILAQGGRAEVTIVVIPNVLGTVTNVVTVSSPFANPASANLTSRLTTIVVETPTIALERAGSRLVFSWPGTADDFVLEVAETLSLPVMWVEDRNPRVMVGDRITVTIKTTSQSKFFRLRKQ